MKWDTEMPEPVIDVEDDTLDASPEGVDVPFDQLTSDTLRNVVSEFVTREWEEMGSVSYTLDQKIAQVVAQLKSGRAKLVFDPGSNTCNIIPVP